MTRTSSIRFAPVVLVWALVLAAPTQVGAAPSDGGPRAQASQFADTPWACTPKKYAAYGRSSRHRRFSGFPFVPGPTAFYTVRLYAEAIRCRGKTRVSYQLYMNTNGFPANRYVSYQLQSAGKHKKYRAACPRVYDHNGKLTNKRNCFLKQEANVNFPRFGARPTYQFRGAGVIRYVRMPNVAEQSQAGGRNLAGKPFNIEIKLGRYIKRHKSAW